MSSFNKYAIKTIQILSGSMEPKEAIALLQDANASHGVIINEQKVPVAMVVANDLKKAASRGAPFLLHPLSNLPPVVIVGSKASMQDLVVRDTTLKSFKAGARGAVIFDDEGIFGIVPTQTILEFWKERQGYGGIPNLPIRKAPRRRMGRKSRNFPTYDRIPNIPIRKVNALKNSYIKTTLFSQDRISIGEGVGYFAEGKLHGDPQLVSCRVICAECSFVNELPFLDRKNLGNCQNTDVPHHILKLS